MAENDARELPPETLKVIQAFLGRYGAEMERIDQAINDGELTVEEVVRASVLIQDALHELMRLFLPLGLPGVDWQTKPDSNDG